MLIHTPILSQWCCARSNFFSVFYERKLDRECEVRRGTRGECRVRRNPLVGVGRVRRVVGLSGWAGLGRKTDSRGGAGRGGQTRTGLLPREARRAGERAATRGEAGVEELTAWPAVLGGRQVSGTLTEPRNDVAKHIAVTRFCQEDSCGGVAGVGAGCAGSRAARARCSCRGRREPPFGDRVAVRCTL